MRRGILAIGSLFSRLPNPRHLDRLYGQEGIVARKVTLDQNRKSPWPLLIEVVRQVTPFLGLTAYEFKILEHLISRTVRDRSLTAQASPEELAKATGASAGSNAKALRKLKKHGVVFRHGDSIRINVYGLVDFYLRLVSGDRPIRDTKRNPIEKLSAVLSVELESEGLATVSISLPVPKLTPRPERTGPICKGSIRVTKGYLRAAQKNAISAACMKAALRRLSKFSEMTVFMRCLDMTLGRGKFQENMVTLDFIEFGQQGFGTLGIPFCGSQIRLALKSLCKRGYIVIEKKFRNAQAFTLKLNAVCLAGLHALDEGSLEAIDLFWRTRGLFSDSFLREMVSIDGIHLISLYDQLRPSYHILLKELHFTFGSQEKDIEIGPQWVKGTCPLATWEHEGGTDENPSFGIMITADGDAYYNCFTCSSDGARPLSELVTKLNELRGEYPADTARTLKMVQRLVPISGHKADVSKEDSPYRPDCSVKPLPQDYVDKFPLLHTVDVSNNEKARQCWDYLVGRGSSPKDWQARGIRYVPWASSPLLVIPFTDINGNCYWMELRSADDKKFIARLNSRFDKMAQAIEFPTPTQSEAWNGLDKIDPSLPVILVEGIIDALRLENLGYSNVIASGTAKVTRSQLEALKALTVSSIILGFDNDAAGKQASSRVMKFLLRNTILSPGIKTADWSLVRRKDGMPCKDPGDLQDARDLKVVMSNLLTAAQKDFSYSPAR